MNFPALCFAAGRVRGKNAFAGNFPVMTEAAPLGGGG
jgi:hypothetical protein